MIPSVLADGLGFIVFVVIVFFPLGLSAIGPFLYIKKVLKRRFTILNILGATVVAAGLLAINLFLLYWIFVIVVGIGFCQMRLDYSALRCILPSYRIVGSTMHVEYKNAHQLLSFAAIVVFVFLPLAFNALVPFVFIKKILKRRLTPLNVPVATVVSASLLALHMFFLYWWSPMLGEIRICDIPDGCKTTATIYDLPIDLFRYVLFLFGIPSLLLSSIMSPFIFIKKILKRRFTALNSSLAILVATGFLVLDFTVLYRTFVILYGLEFCEILDRCILTI